MTLCAAIGWPPATALLSFQDGTRTRIRLPAETWIQKASYTMHLKGQEPVAVVIDPEHVIPDRDRSNNAWKKEQD